MTVTNVQKNPEALTLTITSEFPAPVEKVWQIWENPRLLERWWGPPTYPATVLEHDLRPGGKVSYFMTSPGDERYHGWWKVISVDEPHRLHLEDGFADTEGNPTTDMPTTLTTVTFAVPLAATVKFIMSPACGPSGLCSPCFFAAGLKCGPAVVNPGPSHFATEWM